MKAGGGDQTLVIDHLRHDAQPDWSPDGNTIAFVAGSDLTDPTWDLWTMDVNGGNVTRVTGPDPYGDFQPEWRNASSA
jgi:Tol biopolymer transport system component